MNFALKSRPSLMVSVAEHLEEKGEVGKAVQLYQKAGDVQRALNLCFRAGVDGDGGRGIRPSIFETLKTMTDDLGAAASPEVSFRGRTYDRTHIRRRLQRMLKHMQIGSEFT